MTTIEVAVSRETRPDIVSRLIMWFLGVNYSHILIIYKGRVYDSTGKGVAWQPLSDFKKTHVLPIRQIVTLRKERAFLDGYLAGTKGKEYSESQYFGFLFPKFKRFFKNGRGKTICSEYVARLLNNCSDYHFVDTDFLSPRDVMETVVNAENR